MKAQIIGFIAGLLAFGSASAVAQSSATWTVTGPWGAAGFARVGDFNGDGKADIASPYGAVVYMRLSTGSGFTSETWTVDGGSTQWGSAGALTVGDFNCDGRTDFAQIGYPAAVPIKINNGNGTFTTTNYTFYNGPMTWGPAGFVRVGDFNRDGCRDDIVSPNGASVKLMKANGTLFNIDHNAVVGTWGSPEWTFSGDFNCDGYDDLASANGGNVYMKLNYYGGFSTGHSVTWSVSGPWGSAGWARAGKFASGGCAMDIVSPVNGSTNIYLKTNSNPNFTGSTWTTANGWGDANWTFAGDFNGDGRWDIASANGSNVYMKFP